MQIRKIVTQLSAMVVCLVMSVQIAQAQGYVLGEPLNVTMKVRVKVEGNISAIDTGIDVLCDIAFDGGPRQAVTSRFLPIGEVFAPQTPDGFIAGEIRFENLMPPRPEYLEDGVLTPGELYYRCEARNAENGLSFLRVIGGNLVAVNPVDAGTCSIAGNYVYPKSETPPRTNVTCATIRQ